MTSFHDNPAFVEYEDLLCRLHALMAEGEEDGAEAEVVRDAMDGPSKYLSEAEIGRLKGLSADLYLLSQSETFPIGREVLPLPVLLIKLKQHEEEGDWEGVLAVLRQRGSEAPARAVAFARARAYAALGHLKVAIQFLDFAFRDEPQVPSYIWIRLQWLARSGHPIEAVSYAEKLLASGNIPSLVQVACADAFYRLAEWTESARIYGYSRALQIVEQALRARPRLGEQDRGIGHLLRVVCLWYLGRSVDALTACDQGLIELPRHAGLLRLRAIIKEQTVSDAHKAFDEVIAHARAALPVLNPSLSLSAA
jgi:tetratricopeptide (TPR) repeat protein